MAVRNTNTYLLVGGLAVAGLAAAVVPLLQGTEPSVQAEQLGGPPSQAAAEPDAVTGGAAEPSPTFTVIRGVVAEVIDVPSYTYLRLSTAAGSQWVAVSSTKLERGVTVSVRSQLEMKDFESKALGRTFDSIFFGDLSDGHAAGTPGDLPHGMGADPHGMGADPHAMGTNGMGANPHGMGTDPHGMGTNPHGMGMPEVALDEKEMNAPVPRAAGPHARQIAEVFAQRNKLAGQTVRIQGRVVKLVEGVQGKNYLHLRDGTGSAAEHTHDITVTTQEAPANGSVVTLEGRLGLERDVGLGVAYPVLLEDAVIVAAP